MFDPLIDFIRAQYRTDGFIPLHEPRFAGREADYVNDTIASSFVSSVGAYVERFENNVAEYTNSPAATATVNGTAALHAALVIAGVGVDDLVITQPLTFVATCNAIAYCGARPVFVDVDKHTLGLSPRALQLWLEESAFINDDGQAISKSDGRIIRACLPMHSFGHPADLDGLIEVCEKWHLWLIEDAAEALGSFYKGRHVGTFGDIGTLSFNGNKIITTGGGGMMLASENIAARAKHLTTTAKQPHAYEFLHDEVGYNYRLPNLNAALGCAQLEQIEIFIDRKRQLATDYQAHLNGSDLQFFVEPDACRSNYWLNAVICQDKAHRDALLTTTNEQNVMTRPVWKLMNELPMFAESMSGDLTNANWLAERLVNLPSSVPIVESVN